MPTGYTAPVEDGEITELKDFAATCARAFGAFIHLRDASMKAKLSYPEKPDTSYYARSLEGAKKELSRWQQLSEEERYAEWSAYFHKTLAFNAESQSRHDLYNSRYNAMLAQVHSVDVPAKLENFKQFMISQLEDSKYSGIYSYAPREYAQWCDDQSEMVLRSAVRAEEALRGEEERYAERVRYIDLMCETFGFEVE